ncbi:GAF and ANTAR domain-containing protein [Sciscionella sediminilitoris]|uniref:GAF and ANTAR domain-containing protein n=1 Tax=Sciscionella sediminilitoris TaxID=1445613 RepID=UPI00056AD718|nr:GAF and ANTAR domain-containing protein [Sciscionella sp. SE31]
MTGPHSSIAKTFVLLADTLVTDFDLVEFLYLLADRCQQVLEVDAVGILLADNRGQLNVVAASSERARVLELFQLQNAEGPCLDCYYTGRPVSCPDLAEETERWPRFSQEALSAGFTAVHALPMHLREEAVGGVNLFTTAPGRLDPELLAVGQALADVATIALLHERVSRDRELLAEELQSTLNGRLAIEQAKGILAERRGIGVDEAFGEIRRYARGHDRKLVEIAEAVVTDDPAAAELTGRTFGEE